VAARPGADDDLEQIGQPIVHGADALWRGG
jgi:hypothetical protein